MSFGETRPHILDVLVALREEVFAVVAFRLEVGGAPADSAQVGVALGERKVRAAPVLPAAVSGGMNGGATNASSSLFNAPSLLFDGGTAGTASGVCTGIADRQIISYHPTGFTLDARHANGAFCN